MRVSAEIMAADGLVSKLKGCQATLDQTDSDLKPIFAKHAMSELLGDPRDIDGSKHVIIRTLGAVLLIPDDPLKPEHEMNYQVYSFMESIFEADFDELTYVNDWRLLCLGLVNARVLESRNNPAMEGEFLQNGLYIPAPEICAAMAA